METTEMSALLVGGILGGMFGAVAVLRLIYYIFYVIANWKIFTKAGEKGWKSLIPFYNTYVEYTLMWKPAMAIAYIACSLAGDILMNAFTDSLAAPLIGAIAYIACIVIDVIEKQHVSRAFGHGTGFGIGLFIFEPIFAMILGFGKSEYQGNPDRQ